MTGHGQTFRRTTKPADVSAKETPMLPDEYQKLSEHEDSMWWYRALHRNVLWALRNAQAPVAGELLDAGCGTGGILRKIGATCPGVNLFGLEIVPLAARAAQQKSGATVVAASVDAMPFKDGIFTVIVSADVLYHRWVDPASAAAEAFRCLRPGGLFIVNVPANEWMRSNHDEAVFGAVRFSRRGILGVLNQAGFQVPYISYWNSVLFPLMIVRRLLFGQTNAGSDVKKYPVLLDCLFSAALWLEHGLMRAGVRFPFGGSILAIGVKHE